MRTRPRYITLAEAEPGMVLGAQAKVIQQGMLRYSLPEGQILNSDNLRQLATHQVEFIFIAEPDLRADEQVAIDAAQAAHRVMEIFESAELSEPTMAMLFDQVLAYRSA